MTVQHVQAHDIVSSGLANRNSISALQPYLGVNAQTRPLYLDCVHDQVVSSAQWAGH